ncbi:MAG: SRPBCC domain-containing protein [Acidimicrobiia bacterium]
MDEVFRAINDPSRRTLLDRLRLQDGQTLGELCRHLPEMTRFGVMSHLRVLEDAGLVTTQRNGRSKYHYLNPVPIRLIHDRWISKYAEPTVTAITGLKASVESGERRGMSKPDHIYKAYIAAPAQLVWDAITNGDRTVEYFYDTRVDSTWEIGAPLSYTYPDGTVAADGRVIAVDAPHRLEHTFHARWSEVLSREGPVRQVWALTERDGMTELTVEIYDMAAGTATYRDFTEGIPFIVSGLKTMLETGKAMAAG